MYWKKTVINSFFLLFLSGVEISVEKPCQNKVIKFSVSGQTHTQKLKLNIFPVCLLCVGGFVWVRTRTVYSVTMAVGDSWKLIRLMWKWREGAWSIQDRFQASYIVYKRNADIQIYINLNINIYIYGKQNKANVEVPSEKKSLLRL